MLQHKGTCELKSDRMKLRRFILSDAKSMYKNYATDERVTRFLSWTPYVCVEDVESFLQSVLEEYNRPDTYHWAIEVDGEIIGSISTISIDEKNCSCEVGYCVAYDYWNRGITSEALRMVIRFLFEEVEMHRIMAKHDVDNPASGKVMQKCGMTYEGILREHYLRHDGIFSDALVYGILRREFE